MKRILAIVVCGVLAGFASHARASVLANNMTFNGIEDLFVDESRSNALDRDSSGGLSVGDVIYGYVSFDERNLDGGGNEPIQGGRLAALFSIKVTAETSAGSKIFLHGANDVAGSTFADLLDADLLAEGVGGAAISADAMFVIVESTTAVSPVNTAPDLKWFTGADWDIVATGGVVAANGDFLQVFDNSNSVTGLNYLETASLSVLQHTLGGGVVFLDNVGADDFTIPGTSLSDAFGQIAIRSATITPNTNPDSGNWALQDNGNFAFNAVPEPATFAVWGLLASVGLIGAYRRRKTA